MKRVQDTTVAAREAVPADTTSSVGLEAIPGLATATDLAILAAKIIGIVVVAVLLVKAIDRVASRISHQFDGLPEGSPRKVRGGTIAGLVSSTGRYVIWPSAAVMVLSEVGMNVSALIATAGIASLAIGFGAQILVRDVIAGFFLLFDDMIHVGDIITIDGQAGVVEDIGIRLVKMRKIDGELVMIPAGELRIFGNMSMGYSRIVCEVDLAYEQNVDMLTDALSEVAAEWALANADILLDEPPEVQSVLKLAESTVRMRVLIKVLPAQKWAGERSLFRHIKRRFDERGIEFPFPRQTIYLKQDPS